MFECAFGFRDHRGRCGVSKYLHVGQRLLAIFVFGMVVIGLSPGANAQTTWNGGTGDWFAVGNWSSGVPDASAPLATIDNGAVNILAGSALAGTATSGDGPDNISLKIGGGASASALLLSGGASLDFHRMEIATNGTFEAANDNWGHACTPQPCLLLSGGTLLASAAGGNVYWNGLTLAENTTSLVKAVTSLALSPTANGGNLAGYPYEFRDGAVLQFDGLVTYSGGAQVAAGADTGLVILNGATLQSTAVQLGSGGGIGQLTGAVTTTTVEAGGTLDFNGISGTINSLHGDGTVETGAAVITILSGEFGGAISGPGSLVFSDGVTTLSGVSTYSGPTTVDAGGTLLVNGSIVSSVDVVDGTLGGIGTVGDIAVGAPGIVSPGAAPGAIGELKTGSANFGSAGAKYIADVNVATGQNDLISVTGTATFANGTILEANVIDPLGPSNDVVLLHATGGLTDNGVVLSGVSNTLVVSYSLSSTAQDLILGVDVDFSPSGVDLNSNQTAIGENLNSAVAAGSGGLTPVLTGLIGLLDAGEYRSALDQLSPEIYSYAKIETLFAAEQFSEDLMSCRVADGNGASFIREGQCVWVRGRGRQLDLDATRNNIGLDATIGSFSGGLQVALADDWKLGFAAGYDNVSLDTGTGASADGDRANLGAVIKYNPGSLLVAAAVSGGWSSFDTLRPMAFGGFAGTADGSSDVDYVSGRLHAAYLLAQNGGWYLKPQIDGVVTYLDADGLTETGGGGAALAIIGSSDTIFAVSPSLEIGSELRFTDISVLRPFLRAGVTWRDSDSLDLDSSFAAAPAGTNPFTIRTALDDVLADVSAGFDLINTRGAVLRLQYDGRFGEETAQNSASVKGSVPF